MSATTATLAIVLLCLHGSGIISASSSSTNYYRRPICGANNFYCPTQSTHSCVPRTQRCTLDGNQCNQCVEKSCQHCDYDEDSGEFKVYRYSSDLLAFQSSGRKRGLKLEHQFITYRGLMYEFGDDGSRVQDPNDPNYEYGPGRRSTRNPTYLGLSSCSYEEVNRFVMAPNWDAKNYQLIQNNCQNFVKGLKVYLLDNCSRGRQKRTTDDDFSRYVSSIAATGNCGESSGSQSVVPLPLVSFIVVWILAFLL